MTGVDPNISSPIPSGEPSPSKMDKTKKAIANGMEKASATIQGTLKDLSKAVTLKSAQALREASLSIVTLHRRPHKGNPVSMAGGTPSKEKSKDKNEKEIEIQSPADKLANFKMQKLFQLPNTSTIGTIVEGIKTGTKGIELALGRTQIFKKLAKEGKDPQLEILHMRDRNYFAEDKSGNTITSHLKAMPDFFNGAEFKGNVERYKQLRSETFNIAIFNALIKARPELAKSELSQDRFLAALNAKPSLDSSEYMVVAEQLDIVKENPALKEAVAFALAFLDSSGDPQIIDLFNAFEKGGPAIQQLNEELAKALEWAPSADTTNRLIEAHVADVLAKTLAYIEQLSPSGVVGSPSIKIPVHDGNQVVLADYSIEKIIVGENMPAYLLTPSGKVLPQAKPWIVFRGVPPIVGLDQKGNEIRQGTLEAIETDMKINSGNGADVISKSMKKGHSLRTAIDSLKQKPIVTGYGLGGYLAQSLMLYPTSAGIVDAVYTFNATGPSEEENRKWKTILQSGNSVPFVQNFSSKGDKTSSIAGPCVGGSIEVFVEGKKNGSIDLLFNKKCKMQVIDDEKERATFASEDLSKKIHDTFDKLVEALPEVSLGKGRKIRKQ